MAVTLTVDTKSRLTAILRFLITISIALGISAVTSNARLGGFAAMGAFMALLSDTQQNLSSRLCSLAITFVGVMGAVALGLFLKHLSHGVWIVLALACFGQSLMTFAERFWWLWGKYVLVFLLISVFDFAPNRSAVLGYSLGFLLAALVVIVDHFVWHLEKLGERPLSQLKLVQAGQINSYAYGIVSSLTMVAGLWLSTRLHLSEPGWVGITIIYMFNANITIGFKRVYMRLVGTIVGYAIVLVLLPYTTNQWILAGFIILSSLGIPFFVGRNYAILSIFTTSYVLFVIDWLLYAYGGDQKLLIWRVWDTLLGAACVAVGLTVLWAWNRYRKQVAK